MVLLIVMVIFSVWYNINTKKIKCFVYNFLNILTVLTIIAVNTAF